MDRAVIAAEIEAVGFAVVLVTAEGDEPGHGFTIGLTGSHGHPELIVVGLDDGQQAGPAHALLDALAERVADGERFADGETRDDLLVGYPCVLRSVAPEQHAEWLGAALHWYGPQAFDCLQVVWPDASGRFPWDPDVDPRMRTRQPLLG